MNTSRQTKADLRIIRDSKTNGQYVGMNSTTGVVHFAKIVSRKHDDGTKTYLMVQTCGMATGLGGQRNYLGAVEAGTVPTCKRCNG